MTNQQVQEFLRRLEGPEGCDFKEDGTWKCGGGMDQSLSRNILCDMGISEEEANEFLSECRELGGHCDCEILFNAAERLGEVKDGGTKNASKV